VYVEPGRPDDTDDVLAVWSLWLERILPARQAMDYSEFTPEQDREWIERLVRHPAVRLRVARDHEGRAMGFDTTIPIFAGSVELLQSHPLFAKLLRAYFGQRLRTLPDAAEASKFHYLLHVASTDAFPGATEAALLRDLVGLFAQGGVFLTTTSVPERKHLVEALGFRWVEGAREWVWDREHPADGYALDLSEVGVEAWIEGIVSGSRPPRPMGAEELEEALRPVLLAWEDDELLEGSAVAALLGGADPTAGSLRRVIREALQRGKASGGDGQANALRAVELAYMERGVSHERAAERMLVSRSTFYRLLRRGTQALARELAGR
jgi:hypothetical protein